MASDYDAIVIGGGHNGLVCAAYLAQAGERVLVLERHPVAGGCVATADIPGFPGVQVDIGGLEHGVFANSPAMRELNLVDFGLRYLAREHVYTFPFTDGRSWRLHGDQAKTQTTIAAFSPRDAEAFGRFGAFSAGILDLLSAVSDGPPPSLNDLMVLADAAGKSGAMLMHTFLSSPRQVVDRWFESASVRAGLLNYSTHAQTPPWQLGSGYAPCLALGGQGSGGKRPQGGGKSLIQALVRCIEYHGGTVRNAAQVQRILVRRRRAVGVELAGGEKLSAAHAVISAIDARRVFTQLVDSAYVPSAFRRAMQGLSSGRDNIGELSMACVVSERPVFADRAQNDEVLTGAIWQSGTVEDIENGFLDIRRGAIPSVPSAMWAVPSLLDPTLAPDGCHALWLAAFVPYNLGSGQTWDEAKDQVADHFLAAVGRVAPNLPGSVLGRQIMSPLDWHRRTGNLCGNPDHLDTGVDQMLGNRPSPGLARYRTPIAALYLTGAGTHPGGGITGDPGRNAAREFLRDRGLLPRPTAFQIGRRLERLCRLALAVRGVAASL